MIIGHGDLAQALQVIEEKFPEKFSSCLGSRVAFIASGLSNSQNVTYADLVRERETIFKYGHSNRNHIVYFSSLCVYYSDSPYSKYKQELERYIQSLECTHTIVRIGNITWGKNPHTLLNYLKAHPEAERRDEIRYLVDKEEFLHWMEKIRPGVNDIMNIPGRMVNVKDLVIT